MDNKGRWKEILLCLGIFLVILMSYLFPAMEGKVIQKGDHLNSAANSQEIYEHREKFGEEVLWTNSQFSGMPTFQMNTSYPSNLIKPLKNSITKSFFPAGTGLIFTLFLGFFILLLVMKVDPWLALIGGLAYAFSTYFITSFEVGHTGKLRVIGFIAPVVATIHLTLRGKWLLGGALTAFTIAAALGSNHLQINYYLALLIGMIMVVEGIVAIRQGWIKHYLIAASILLGAGILAIGPNTSSIWTTYSYSKETIRGGSSPLEKEKGEDTGGLDKDYAMRWSYGKMETFNLLIPSLYGGGNSREYSQDTRIARSLEGRLSEDRIDRFQQSRFYWGDQPFTAGPVYIGAGVCFLFIAGFLLMRGPTRWWLLVATVLSIMMAWGKHLPGLNYFLFDHFPFYSKFRSPSMILTITCFTVPLMGILGLQELLNKRGDAEVWKRLKWAFYGVGGVCLFFALLGPSILDFEGSWAERIEKREQRLKRMKGQGNSKRINAQLRRIRGQKQMLEKIKKDRATLLQQSSVRSFVFIGLAFLAIWGFHKGNLSRRYFLLAIGGVIGLDLLLVDSRYLTWDDFSDKDSTPPSQYQLTAADRTILSQELGNVRDAYYPKGDPKTPAQHYRVYKATRGAFQDAFTSYHHRSIGGYHAAKLIRYQDLIERQLQNGNMRVLNMLNTQWFIQRTKKRKGQREVARPNPGALGNAWFVEEVRWAENAQEEMSALDSTPPIRNPISPSREAIVHKEFEGYFKERSQRTKDRGSSIELSSYKANHLKYQADVKAKSGKLAVFSEIYYEGSGNDWKARIDGKKVPHIRVNYALRALWIPPGEHRVSFEFRPRSYYTGEKIALTSSIMILLLIVLAGLYEYRAYRYKQRQEDNDRIGREGEEG